MAKRVDLGKQSASEIGSIVEQNTYREVPIDAIVREAELVRVDPSRADQLHLEPTDDQRSLT